MCGGFTVSITVLADDLSGAAESAAAFLGRQVSVCLQLAPGPNPSADVTVLDLDSRHLGADEARSRQRAAIAAMTPDTLVLKKIDSLLRGNVRAEVEVLAERGPVTVAAALPAQGRAVIGGVLHVNGVPLHRSTAWTAESDSPPQSVTEMFGAGVTVCDAGTDTDLDAIVAGAAPGTQLVGTSALAAAVARTFGPGACARPGRRRSPGVLAVVGTADPKAREQVRRLVAHGFRPRPVPVEALLHGVADETALADGPIVVTVTGAVEPAHARDLSAALGRLVATLADQQRDLILTGGETARAVVDAIGITDLRPIHEVHHGAVVSVASDGRSVATRPGSFGDDDSLVAIAEYLCSSQHVQPQPKDHS